MAVTFAGYLAGDRAALTKAVSAYDGANDQAQRQAAVTRIAEIINRAPQKGFTYDQVINGRDLPAEVIPLIRRPRLRRSRQLAGYRPFTKFRT